MFQVDLRPRFGMRLGALGLRGLPSALDGGEVSLRLLAGRFDGCTGAELGKVDLRGCGGVIAGTMIIEGRGYATNVTAVPPYVAAAVGAHLSTPVASRFAFFASVEAVAPVLGVRPEIIDPLTGSITATLEMPPVGGLISLGVVGRFD